MENVILGVVLENIDNIAIDQLAELRATGMRHWKLKVFQM